MRGLQGDPARPRCGPHRRPSVFLCKGAPGWQQIWVLPSVHHSKRMTLSP